jgi:hypothetical protein
VSFERLDPVERVALAERHVRQLGSLPGSPRLGVRTLEAMRLVELALCDDEISDERFQEFVDAWADHLKTLSPVDADEARHRLQEFGRVVEGLRGPPTEEGDQ